MRDLEDIHRRPAAYVGNTNDGSGIQRMLFEVLNNAISEAQAGHCSRIEVTLNAGGSATVRDNGRGIPTDVHPREGISAAELIITRLHVAGGITQETRNVLDGLPGVGLAVVTALSEVLDLRVWRDGKEHFIRCRMGKPDAPIAIVGSADQPDGTRRRGTEITFLPSSQIFTKIDFDFAILDNSLRGFSRRSISA